MAVLDELYLAGKTMGGLGMGLIEIVMAIVYGFGVVVVGW